MRRAPGDSFDTPPADPFEQAFDQAVEHIRQDRPAEAVEAWQRAAALAPERPDVHYNLGNALKKTGTAGGRRRGQLRAGLRQRVAASPLCDGQAYAQNVEDALLAMWERAGEKGR